MVLSFLYLVFRALLGALVRSRRGLGLKDIELIVLRHELEAAMGKAATALSQGHGLQALGLLEGVQPVAQQVTSAAKALWPEQLRIADAGARLSEAQARSHL